MATLKNILTIVVALNVFTVLILSLNQFWSRNDLTKDVNSHTILKQTDDSSDEFTSFVPNEPQSTEPLSTEPPTDSSDDDALLAGILGDHDEKSSHKEIDDYKDGKYVFIDPSVAEFILKKLDIYSEVGLKSVKGANYTKPSGGYTANNEYCNEHRKYFVKNTDSVFSHIGFTTNYWRYHKFRTMVLPKIGKDLVKETTPLDKEMNKQFLFDFPLNSTFFFTWNLFYDRRQVGKQFSCLSQGFNHIPGHYKMARKDSLGGALVDYAKKYEDREHCFNYNKYFPQTWVLTKKDQCEDFFKQFLSPKYARLKKERTVVYYRKIGADVHEGKGVFPVMDKEEEELRDLYQDGKLCGKIKQNFLMQTNIHNLLLADGRKFGVRMYLFIASVNPVIAYYHDGYYRLSVNKYDPESKDKSTFVTNIGVNIVEPTLGMSEEEIQDYTCWFNDQFHKHLMEEGKVTDKKWLDNYLRPEYKRVMIHLVRMAQGGFLKKSSLFEIYGIDFVMDTDLGLWFIEANATPLIDGFTKESTRLINRMLFDMFDIVINLLRSRMKRVIQYVNTLSEEVRETGEIPHLEAKQKHFKKISANYFEPEYRPAPGNGFSLIIDETKKGRARYNYLLDEECL